MAAAKKQSIDGFEELKPGDNLFAQRELFNALIRNAKGESSGVKGVSDENGSSYGETTKQLDWVEVEATEDIAEYSVFVLDDSVADSDPIIYNVRKFVAGDEGKALVLLANGPIEINAAGGFKGHARILTYGSRCKFAIAAGGVVPDVGDLCGPKVDTFGVTKESFGLICIGAQDADDLVECVRLSEGGRGFIGKTDAAVAKGATVAVSRYKGDLTDTGKTDQVKFQCSGAMINKWVLYVKIDDVFFALEVEKELITFVTDVRVSAPNFQKKTQQVSVTINAVESAWTTYHTGEDCPPP